MLGLLECEWECEIVSLSLCLLDLVLITFLTSARCRGIDLDLHGA